jgi:hypothetical protein
MGWLWKYGDWPRDGSHSSELPGQLGISLIANWSIHQDQTGQLSFPRQDNAIWSLINSAVKRTMQSIINNSIKR